MLNGEGNLVLPRSHAGIAYFGVGGDGCGGVGGGACGAVHGGAGGGAQRGGGAASPVNRACGVVVKLIQARF